MKKITTQGICCIEPLSERGDWYWGMDYTGGDMYEAMELYQQDSMIKHNRLLLVHYPDGKTVQPVHLTDGQFLGTDLFAAGGLSGRENSNPALRPPDRTDHFCGSAAPFCGGGLLQSVSVRSAADAYQAGQRSEI